MLVHVHVQWVYMIGTCTCTVGVHNWYTMNSYLASTHVFAYGKYYIALLSMFVTHCTMQRHTVRCRDTLYDAETHCTMQRHTVRCTDTLYDAETHCTMQRHTVRCRDTLYDAETRCTMQRHAVRCRDTLYDAVTHCMMMHLLSNF